jgi:hypothetical protein
MKQNKKISIGELTRNFLDEISAKILGFTNFKLTEKAEYPYNAELSEDPSMKWTKKELKNFMEIHKIKYNSGDTKSDLLEKIKWNR